MNNFKSIILVGIIISIIFFFFLKKMKSKSIGYKYFNNMLVQPGERHFNNLRQLTFSGENAEAYFSKDGKSLIFQSHDGDSLCDQIYIMDIETGQSKLVSTGYGVTTCAYFDYPACKNIIYSSTHLGSKDCPPKPDYRMGYVWKLYQDYDVFASSIDGDSIVQLTDSKNYDAEATVAFDGSKIIYTSMSSGDLDLWTMNKDGSNKKQLTNQLGYDGGAFFSYDSKKIVCSRLGTKRLRIAGLAELNGYNLDIIQNRIRPLITWCNTMFPDINTKDIKPWAGLRPMSPNMLPIYKKSKEDRVWYNTGHGHLGWTLGAATGDLLAEKMING